ncbi:MAG TPA: hypothetical protein VNK95_03430 [Caldilineaceae bacterium]|nr:hypothetical protein [Caldilineaceae bacterium]
MVALAQPLQTRPGLLAPGSAHPPAWFAPQPLWRVIPSTELAARRHQPVILRFTGDSFMQELNDLLAAGRGSELRHYVAQPERWDQPQAGLDETGRDLPGLLKLYQPSQNRYYLVAGALACALPGVPDRTVDARQAEQVFFVIRRRRGSEEAGWSTNRANAAAGWVTVDAPDRQLAPGEEQLPLFPLAFHQDGVRRRLLAGLIPAGRREQYQVSPTAEQPGPDQYVIRLVYARPACHDLTISLPTRPFTLASFFDPDAPARPIRMTMPVDARPSALGKYDKQFNVQISNQLQAQINRIKGLKELMENDTNPEEPLDFGLICSFSIPIITICALILLLVVVNLLNFIFQWLPFFRICLPIPLRTE